MALEDNLIKRIQEQATPLKPIPTALKSSLKKLSGIKAVLFDIYGTLFISGSGDISMASEKNNNEAIKKLLNSHNIQLDINPEELFSAFQSIIQKHHQQSKAKGIEYPEVEIRDIWTELIQGVKKAEDIALDYEMASNPVWPMPNSQKILEETQLKNIKLGIISNAQFYTPLLFEAFYRKNLRKIGFLPELCLFSYVEKYSKPAQSLFHKSAQALKSSFNIKPTETLFVGNDMKKDILPAHKEAFKTALFAGDKRSLRLESKNLSFFSVTPDLIIDDLSQLTECIT